MHATTMYRSMTVNFDIGCSLTSSKEKSYKVQESVGKGVYKANGSALHAANICLTHEACFFFCDIMVPIIIL